MKYGKAWAETWRSVWPPLTAVKREKFAKRKEKYCKGKVVTFTVQSLILYQYPVDLLTFLELY